MRSTGRGPRRNWETAAREGVEILGPATPAGRRIAEYTEYFEFIRKELVGVLARWHDHKSQPN